VKAVIWNYRFGDMRTTWKNQFQWLVNSLHKNGVEVKVHKDFKCKGLENLSKYNHKKDNPCDICIYNHATIANLVGNVVKADQNWFFKPTVPDEYHTTLDTLGYGPYSSLTYQEPDFKNVEIGDFFDTKVKDWLKKRTSKFDNYLYHFKNKVQKVPFNDYFLIIGQCGGDEVVTKHDFGSYFVKLEQVIKELVRISDRTVVVKLHPFTDGKDVDKIEFASSLKEKYEAISSKVKVYIGATNIHNFIEKAYCVLLANSGAGFETMMHHKPIISWGYPEYHWITYDLRHLVDLQRAIKLDWFNREESDKFLYWYMEEYCYYNQETCDRRVKDLINGLVN